MTTIVNNQGELVELGSRIKCFRGEEHTLIGYDPPRHEGSSGRVIVETKSGMVREFFPSVFDLRIVRGDK